MVRRSPVRVIRYPKTQEELDDLLSLEEGAQMIWKDDGTSDMVVLPDHMDGQERLLKGLPELPIGTPFSEIGDIEYPEGST